LDHLGYAYDFGFDFETHKSFSCTEFIYFIYRCVCPFVDIKLVEQSILFLAKKYCVLTIFYIRTYNRFW